jgi:hypothetical protein
MVERKPMSTGIRNPAKQIKRKTMTLNWQISPGFSCCSSESQPDFHQKDGPLRDISQPCNGISDGIGEEI